VDDAPKDWNPYRLWCDVMGTQFCRSNTVSV